jgi:hypothetical protein
MTDKELKNSQNLMTKIKDWFNFVTSSSFISSFGLYYANMKYKLGLSSISDFMRDWVIGGAPEGTSGAIAVVGSNELGKLLQDTKVGKKLGFDKSVNRIFPGYIFATGFGYIDEIYNLAGKITGSQNPVDMPWDPLKYLLGAGFASLALSYVENKKKISSLTNQSQEELEQILREYYP